MLNAFATLSAWLDATLDPALALISRRSRAAIRAKVTRKSSCDPQVLNVGRHTPARARTRTQSLKGNNPDGAASNEWPRRITFRRAFRHAARAQDEVWSLYGAPWLQPMAITGKSPGREDRRIKRNPCHHGKGRSGIGRSEASTPEPERPPPSASVVARAHPVPPAPAREPPARRRRAACAHAASGSPPSRAKRS